MIQIIPHKFLRKTISKKRKLIQKSLSLSDLHSFLLFIPLLGLTDRQTDGESNTIASRGLEEPFFQLCVSFWFQWEKGFGLHTHVLL